VDDALERRIRHAAKLIDQILYVTVASTSDTGEPWNTPVYAAFDQGLCMYWSSDRNAQHSRNIRANGRVFLVIYDSTAEWGSGRGVYIKAQAHELLHEHEVIRARRLLRGRVSRAAMPDEYAQHSGQAARRVYRAEPLQLWVNDYEYDESGSPIRDLRAQVPIEPLLAYMDHV
jgi:uncharacterized protein YhbP (UPF0306 family)